MSEKCTKCGHPSKSHGDGECVATGCGCVSFVDAVTAEVIAIERIATAMESIARSLDAMRKGSLQ